MKLLFVILVFAPFALTNDCLDIEEYFKRLENVNDWDSHYKLYKEVRDCLDGAYSQGLSAEGYELIQTNWEQFWKKEFFKKDTTYYNFVYFCIEFHNHEALGLKKDSIEINSLEFGDCPKEYLKKCTEFKNSIINSKGY